MNEEQFVNIDLNDDNVCSVCKLGTERETLSFCHICFELNIEGIPKSDLLHTRSLRGHRDCFEKFHLIANQSCPQSKLSKSTYAEVKNILSKKINWIIQYAQNKDLDLDSESSKQTPHRLFSFRHQRERKLLPQFDAQVPKYAAKSIDGNSRSLSNCSQSILEPREPSDFGLDDMLQQTGATFCCSSTLWSSHNQPSETREAKKNSSPCVQNRHPQYSREQLSMMTLGEVEQLYGKLLKQIQDVFEELTKQVQEKDSLASQLNVRHIAIEQLLKNCSKLPCLQMGRAAMKSNISI
ncbi:protein EURL homolog isoform X2 [Hemicordylus capensis]|nr:protein EURL homolog isoform X2 [Hemicordylus capensis]XP_053164715.1 protein EURL homolog isoform X2 [Hemicordylus capensis]XP_053164716.1 protein EURL homolog isoform X2 [Hemicordylus capensis]XP_053164717.1 protein EURL homolog isoform X2 [Hemicordylus capensis]